MRPSSLAVLALCAVWVLMVFLVNPVGEFPLNDDWSYSRAVQTLVEQHRLELTGFTSMPLVGQVLWGTLFCLPFGFSFTALRLSTITLGLVGIVATYKLLEESRADSILVLLGTVIVAANPLYFHLSLTFMTDVPFFAFSMLSFLFLIRFLRTGKYADLIVGYAFTLIALLIRQLAIVIPLSFLFAYWVRHGMGRRLLVEAFTPTALFAGLLLGFPALLRHTIGLPALYNRSFEPIVESATLGPAQIPLILTDRLFVELLYLGLFTLPFLIALGVNPRAAGASPTKRTSTYVWLGLFAAAAGVLLWQHRTMPLAGNVLFDLGLGPPLLRDTYLLGLPDWPAAPRGFWLLITAAALFGSVLLVRQLAASLRYMWWHPAPDSFLARPTCIFLLSAAGIYYVATGITGFLDRYLVWLLPPLLAYLLASQRESIVLHAARWRRWLGVTLITAFGLFAVVATHDYLAWNRARWQALTDLMSIDRVPYTEIDGGFEFNGWYGYNADYVPQASKSWWWVQGDDTVISFGPLPGYVVSRSYPFERWLGGTQADILVLQRSRASLRNETRAE